MLIAAALSSAELQNYFPIPDEYRDIVADARGRLIKDNVVADARGRPIKDNVNAKRLIKSKVFILVPYDKDICVYVPFIDGSLGNNPIYCYDINTHKFLRGYESE